MRLADNPNWFVGNPLDRASAQKKNPDWVRAQLERPDSLMAAFWRSQPLVENDGDGLRAVWLSMAARREFPAEAPVVFLGLKDERAFFAIDASASAETAERAPFADLGTYMPLRDAAFGLNREGLAVLSQGRWLLDWHRRHEHCAVCGAMTASAEGGAKRVCPACGAEHFPRTDPVAIVLPVRNDACLLGRGPNFPPTFFSALAGYVEPGETLEECAVREVFEETGVRLGDVRYQFAQAWPFPSSLMVGFIADAETSELTLDPEEIVEARWVTREEARALILGPPRQDLRPPPVFTIAHQLIARWSGAAAA